MTSFLPSSFSTFTTQPSKPATNSMMGNMQSMLDSARSKMDTVPAIKVHVDALVHTVAQARRGLAVIQMDSKFVVSITALLQSLVQEFGESMVSVSTGNQGSPRVKAVHGAMGRQLITLAELIGKFQTLRK